MADEKLRVTPNRILRVDYNWSAVAARYALGNLTLGQSVGVDEPMIMAALAAGPVGRQGCSNMATPAIDPRAAIGRTALPQPLSTCCRPGDRCRPQFWRVE